MTQRIIALLVMALPGAALADGPRDNLPDNVRPVPPPGIKVPPEVRVKLGRGLDELGDAIIQLARFLRDKPALRDLLPDVAIYHKAVKYALTYDEFYNQGEFQIAEKLLTQGMDRATSLRDGKSPWATQTGLVVRAYVSKIDGSVQPYGLVVPASYRPDSPHKFRLDIWCHGRGEPLTELNFINGRQTSRGEFTPKNAFVLHLYGRYCCANKLAGEVDLFEALADVKKHYPIDENRLVIRGFSMGGAACWQFAVHFPGMWAAAAPGAGFSETPDFLKVFQKETLKPTWFQQKLWHMYDCTDYAINLFNCPTVAYSGELDSQKQAADMMEKAMAKEGLKLMHIIGPGTHHAYHPQAKAEINRRIDAIVERGRNPVPTKVRFTTWTLRYNRAFWVTVDRLKEHWERGRIDAEIVGKSVVVHTSNVTAFTLSFAAGSCPFDSGSYPDLVIHDSSIQSITRLRGGVVMSDRSWSVAAHANGSSWDVLKSVPVLSKQYLFKTHGVQGPIDDAFLDSFIMVRPTGKPLNETVGKWAQAEMAHAVAHWRSQFRGDARVRDDKDVNDADIANSNLILWGDPSSNKLLAKVLPKLPIRWDEKRIRGLTPKWHSGKWAGSFESSHHVPVMVYPNPLNPNRYIVLNSGFTFREYDYLNNARQVPKLPDYAVIDVSTPPNSRWPGKVVDAGFFTEEWKMPPPKED
jgi:hypothetical protein